MIPGTRRPAAEGPSTGRRGLVRIRRVVGGGADEAREETGAHGAGHGQARADDGDLALDGGPVDDGAELGWGWSVQGVCWKTGRGPTHRYCSPSGYSCTGRRLVGWQQPPRWDRDALAW